MLNSIVALAGLAYASYTDLRETIVPDNLNYALIAFGFLYHLYLSFTTQSFNPIALSIAGAVLAFIFSYLLWRIGAWAGGDVKLFTALGALIPGAELPIFPFIIFINAILLSFPFVMFHVFARTATTKSLHKIFKQMIFRGLEQGFLLGAYSVGFIYLLPLFNFPQWLSLPLILLAFFLPRSIRIALALLIGIPGIINTSAAPLLFTSSLLITLFWQAISYGKQYALRKKLSVSKLVEGMIPAEIIYLKNKKLAVFHPTLQQKLTLYEPPKTIASSYRAAGLENSDISSLKKHGLKTIWIKEGTPMVPILFLGALSAILFGNLAVILFELL